MEYVLQPQDDNELMFRRTWVGSEWTPVPIDFYPGGEPRINSEDTRGEIGDILLRPKSIEKFLVGMFFVDAIQARGNELISLYLPYVPGARQDRLNSDGDMLFTLKSVAEMINDRNFMSVHVVDPHSDVTPALIHRCKSTPAWILLRNHIKAETYNAVVAPDAGAAKRAFAVAQWLGLPMIQAWKHRDVKTGSISGFGMEPPQKPSDREVGHLLVVDDICDGGGTFKGLAKVISDNGFTADLFVSHGIFSQGIDFLLEDYGKIITTDTIIQRYDESDRFTIIKAV